MGSIAEPTQKLFVLGLLAALTASFAIGSVQAAQPIVEKADAELRGIVNRWQPYIVRVTTVQQVKTLEFKIKGNQPDTELEVRRVFRRSEDVPGLIVDPDGYVLTSAEAISDVHHVVVTLGDERYFRARFVGLDTPRGLGLVDIGPLEAKHFSWKPVDDLGPGSFALALAVPEEGPVRLDLCLVNARGSATAPRSESPAWLQITGPAEIQRGTTIADVRGRLVGMVVAPAGRRWSVPRGVIDSIKESGEADSAAELEAALQLLKRSASLSGWWVVTAPLIRSTLDDLLAAAEETADPVDADEGAGWMGLKIAPRVPEDRRAVLAGRPGAYIQSVCENGPAKAAGLKRGDIVILYGGHPVSDGRQLGGLILASDPGKTIEITLIRGDAELALPVSVGVF